MPKDRKPRARHSFFSKNCASSEESIPSLSSGEYSHIPLEPEEIDELTFKFANQLSSEEQQQQRTCENKTMDQMMAQLEQLTQQVAALSAKQNEQDSQVNQLRVANQVGTPPTTK